MCVCKLLAQVYLPSPKLNECYAAGAQDDALLAYQVCFDLFEDEQQSFSLRVRAHEASRVAVPYQQSSPDTASPACNTLSPRVKGTLLLIT